MENKEINEDIAKIKRNKKLAITKAKNEMLDGCIDMVEERLKDTPDIKEDIISQINEAKDENIDIARKEIGATVDEINSATYGQASQHEVEKYNRWAEKNNIDVEELKKMASMSNSGKVLPPERKKKKRFSFQKNDDEKDDVIYGAINPETRTVAGHGYEKHIKKEKESDIMNEIIEEKNEAELKKELNESLIERENRLQNNIQQSYEDFDPSMIPENCEYDMIPLPSKGECYPSKHSRIAVRCMNASDEDIIASPNLYEDGRIIDIILKRCILDKTIKPENLCKGDRDAIVLWLRSDAYGPEFPIRATNPKNEKTYDSVINLTNIMEEYLPFDLRGDENGYFTYVDGNNNIFKFKLLTYSDEEKLKRIVACSYIRAEKLDIQDALKKIAYNIGAISSTIEVDDAVQDAINYIGNWNDKLDNKIDFDSAVSNSITTQMSYQTVSINGNEDREFIENFIKNMKAGEARKYRMFMFENTPGLNLNVKIEVPESDGGGSFSTFLPIENTIFITF